MKPFLIVLVLLVAVTVGCSEKNKAMETERPLILLTNSQNRMVRAFGIMDSVFGSFSGLRPKTGYHIRVMRSDEKEISHSIHTSDRRGIIPTVPLWWYIGVEYGKSRTGKLNPERVLKYKYHCVLERDKRMIARVRVPVLSPEISPPLVYTSNGEGDPLNAFAHKKENIYLTARNLLPGSEISIHVVPNASAVVLGDRIRSITKPRVMRLEKGQREFTTLIARAGELDIGAYDFVLEQGRRDGVVSRKDIVGSVYHVGFTLFKLPPAPPPPLPPHVEAQVACQSPPQDPATGTVIGVPNPVYKDYFSPVEEVWAAVNPSTGGHDYANQNARLYVVNHKTQSQWTNGTLLSDVSGGYESVVIQPGCANVNYTRVWSNPQVSAQGYDVVVDFAPFGVYNRGQDIVDQLDALGFEVPALWVCLESVSFNHNSSSDTSDAMNIRENAATDVHVPEWEKQKKTYPAAYIKNKTITVKAVFSAAPGVTSARIRAAHVGGSLGDVTQKTVSFAGGTSGSVSFNVTATTPGAVKYFYQKWRWYCADVNSTGSAEVHLADSKNKIYVVLARPQGPWTTSGQTEPWTDALNKSCLWAYGETTATGAADKITRKLFKNTGGLYDTVNGSSSYTADGYGTSFNLSGFLANITGIGVVNCYDMGKSLVTFANVAGCGLSYKRSNSFGYLNCIYAIGRGWTNNPFHDNTNPIYGINPNPIVPGDWDSGDGRSSFGNHVFGSISDNIYDACLTADTDGDPDYGPPFLETWMIDQPWNTYKTRVVDNNPSSATGTPVIYTFTIY